MKLFAKQLFIGGIIVFAFSLSMYDWLGLDSSTGDTIGPLVWVAYTALLIAVFLFILAQYWIYRKFNSVILNIAVILVQLVLLYGLWRSIWD